MRRLFVPPFARFSFGSWRGEALVADAVIAMCIGLLLRLAVVFWARGTFPPADDGHFYQIFASRLASGQGYTWVWPDAAVTFAAHYPVGYPALLAPIYWIFSPEPLFAMLLNAGLGSLSIYAAHRLAAVYAGRLGAVVAAMLVALHPSLVLYTPALMTEGVVASLLLIAAFFAIAHRGPAWLKLLASGTLLGVATLVRPQSVLIAPVLGFYALPQTASLLRRTRAALLHLLIAIAICLPWTLRNCQRMQNCVFVSANGGWNLLIGTAPDGGGGWVALDEIGVPQACRHVYEEVLKDDCFARAAKKRIWEYPGAWLALIPAKLSMTFDYSGAAAYYLHASNEQAFDGNDKLVLGVVETLWQRFMLGLAIVAMMRAAGPGLKVRQGSGFLAMLALLTPHAFIAYLGLALQAACLLRSRIGPVAVPAGAVVLATALVHAAFFGAGRYALVTFGLVATLAGCVLGPPGTGPLLPFGAAELRAARNRRKKAAVLGDEGVVARLLTVWFRAGDTLDQRRLHAAD